MCHENGVGRGFGGFPGGSGGGSKTVPNEGQKIPPPFPILPPQAPQGRDRKQSAQCMYERKKTSTTLKSHPQPYLCVRMPRGLRDFASLAAQLCPSTNAPSAQKLDSASNSASSHHSAVGPSYAAELLAHAPCIFWFIGIFDTPQNPPPRG